MGVVQFVFSDHAWISSFVPQAQALALNYIFPMTANDGWCRYCCRSIVWSALPVSPVDE
jgi:hypothetical protein